MFRWLFEPQVPVAPPLESLYPVRRRVVVNPKHGEVMRGVLWESGPEFLVLKGAELLRPRGEVTPIDGDVVIYRANVAFMQVLPVGAE